MTCLDYLAQGQLEQLSQTKQTKKLKMALWLEHSPSMYKALSLTPSSAQKSNQIMCHLLNLLNACLIL